MKQIKTVEQLRKAAEQGKAVIGSCMFLSRRPSPAVFILHMQCTQVLWILKRGLWIYEKPRAK